MKKSKEKLSRSDKIDRVITNRWLGLADLCRNYVPGILCICNYSGNYRNGLDQRHAVRRDDHSGGRRTLWTPSTVRPGFPGLLVDGIIGGVGARAGLRAADAGAVHFPGLPGRLWLYGSRRFLSCDRIFRKFGLSGKSFIPMLIGSGCGVPGVMASRTIENDRDRKMTVMTTTFIPCGAKLPIIALIGGALFSDAAWVAPVCYFIGIAAVVCSGIILKKFKRFAGEPAPFVMELPAYHLPTVGSVLRSMWWSAAGPSLRRPEPSFCCPPS